MRLGHCQVREAPGYILPLVPSGAVSAVVGAEGREGLAWAQGNASGGSLKGGQGFVRMSRASQTE